MDNELFQPLEVTAWRVARARLQQAINKEHVALQEMEAAGRERLTAQRAEADAKSIMLKALAS